MQRELKAAALFTVIAFVVSWGLVGAMFLGGFFAGEKADIGRAIAALVFPLGAAIAAAATAIWWRQKFDAAPLGFTIQLSHWVLLSWLAPALVAVLTLLVSKFIPGLAFSFDPSAHPLPPDADEASRAAFEQAKSASPMLRIVAFFVGTLFQGTLLNLVFRLGEEVGWRGLMLRLLAPFGFWRSSILIGFLAGMWSMPLVLLGAYYPGATQTGLFLIVPFMVLASPLVTFFRLRSGSILGATLFSASLAAMIRFVALPYVSGSHLLYGIPGVAGMIALVLVNVLVVVPRWREAEQDLRELTNV